MPRKSLESITVASILSLDSSAQKMVETGESQKQRRVADYVVYRLLGFL